VTKIARVDRQPDTYPSITGLQSRQSCYLAQEEQFAMAGMPSPANRRFACTSGLCILSTMSRPPKVISEYMAQLGRKGGEAKGPRKARSPEHYRKAAQARWAKRKETRT
jgi:hypothetical protein